MRGARYLIAFALFFGALPAVANADNAFTLRDVEAYTGPGSEYPPVATLPPNIGVEVAGCLGDWSWCDVIFADNRGWVYAVDLGYPYQNNRVAIIEYGPRLRLPVVTFSLPVYWDAHYRSRPWYRERDVWVNRVHAQVDRGGRPPEGRSARGALPAPGVTSAPQTAAPRQGQATQPAPQPQYTQPRQPTDTMQRPNQPQTSQPQQTPQQSQVSPQQNQAAPNARAREAAPPSAQATPPQPSMQPPSSPQSSMQSGRGPEARPPENRAPENRPPEGRPPEGRPAAAQQPGPPGSREAGPPGQREGQGPGQRAGQNPGQGRGDQDRGEGGPDRDRQ